MSAVLRGSYNYLWDITKPLGQGATSMVYKGRNKNTGEEVAVKVFNQAGSLRPLEVQMREYTVMRKLKHENIVALLDIEEEQGTYHKVIVMELATEGSLYNMLEEPANAFGLEEEEFLRVLKHVAAGMKHLRDHGVAHRDIKPGNILRYRGQDGRSIYRLTDFGAARELEEEEQFMSLYGTEEYLHPDIYERAVLRTPVRKQFTAAVDLWSLGVTFFHVATGLLPFKPFGGRRNKDQMFQITRGKESGVISGVQKTHGGPVEWSKELPATCKLSCGLRSLVTPILAGLLESNPSRVWNFETFFCRVENVISKIIIEVFSPQNWSCLTVYIKRDEKLPRLQDLIAEQTDIASTDQLLIFDGQLIRDIVDSMQPVCQYPKGITTKNPIFVFNRTAIIEIPKFSSSFVPEFPKMSSSMGCDNDYSVAKMCAGVSCFILKEVNSYCLKQELLRRAVSVYVHELYHECDHLQDYQLHLEKNCDTTTKWKISFLKMIEANFRIVQALVQQAMAFGHGNGDIVGKMREFESRAKPEIDDAGAQVECVYKDVFDRLKRLSSEQLQKRRLRHEWTDSVGCSPEDRCVAKIDVILDSVLTIKQHFQEDRKKVKRDFNDEQIHNFERSKLVEQCTKIRSLFLDHCSKGAKEQFSLFQRWYRSAQDCRQESRQIEEKMLKLVELEENYVKTMDRYCDEYIKLSEENIRWLERRSVVGEAQPSEAGRGLQSVKRSISAEDSETRDRRRALARNIIQSVNENLESVQDMKRSLETNTDILKRFSELLEESSPGIPRLSTSVQHF